MSIDVGVFEIILKGRLNGKQRNRLAILLDMEYTPSELANEIGFAKRQVYRVYLPLGCPHRKDDRRHIWINGKEFRSWILNIYKKRKLGLNEAFCLSCKKPVQMKNKVRKQSGRLFYYLCTCPNCGRKLVRIITRGKPINDQSE
jgi:hypothetical protein